MNGPLGPTDWYYRNYVPKGFHENLAFRRQCLDAGYAKPEFAQELWIMCSRDILFYANTFGWLLESRKKARWKTDDLYKGVKEIPLITRPYQDDGFRDVMRDLGERDITWEKSREMGVTWMMMYVIDHQWRFEPWTAIGIASKDEASVDNPRNPDSLLSKLAFIHDHLPKWLRPEYEYSASKHTRLNLENNSSVQGYAATGAIARGERKTFFVQDEQHFFPAGSDYTANESIQHVTPCRVMVSTLNRERGPSGAYYDAIMNQDADCGRIKTHWSMDPEKSAGLYKSQNGVLEILDKDYQYPEGYKHIPDGKLRSPYYDWECNRVGATPQSIAAELDMSFEGSVSKPFPDDVISKCKTTTRTPVKGRLYVEGDDDCKPTWIFEEGTEGDFLSWGIMGRDKVGSSDRFVAGFDVSYGTGGDFSSYSCIEVINVNTGEQVAEFKSNTLDPVAFAHFGVGVCKYFNDAYMVPEVNGPGRPFINEVKRLNYSNVYMDVVEDINYKKHTKKVGLHAKRDTKEKLFREMGRAILTSECVIRSEKVAIEFGQYVYRNADIEHIHERSSADEAGKGKGHGDCAIAIACAWLGCRDRPADKPRLTVPKPTSKSSPYGTMADRTKAWEEEQKRESARSYWNPY